MVTITIGTFCNLTNQRQLAPARARDAFFSSAEQIERDREWAKQKGPRHDFNESVKAEPAYRTKKYAAIAPDALFTFGNIYIRSIRRTQRVTSPVTNLRPRVC